MKQDKKMQGGVNVGWVQGAVRVIAWAGGDENRPSCQEPQFVLWVMGSQVRRRRREDLGRR